MEKNTKFRPGSTFSVWPKFLMKNIHEIGSKVHFVQIGLALSKNGHKVVDVAPVQSPKCIRLCAWRVDTRQPLLTPSTTHTSKYGIFLTLSPISRPQGGYLLYKGDSTTTLPIFVDGQCFLQSGQLADAQTAIPKQGLRREFFVGTWVQWYKSMGTHLIRRPAVFCALTCVCPTAAGHSPGFSCNAVQFPSPFCQ